jgi:excisionase family DNA binding protein
MLDKKSKRETKHKIPDLITLKEACEILKVHPNTLRQWDAKDILPAIRIGAKRAYRYREGDILNLLSPKRILKNVSIK